MTIKKAIGTFKAHQSTARYHKIVKLGAPTQIIQSIREMSADYEAGKFGIYPNTDSSNGEDFMGKVWTLSRKVSGDADIELENKIAAKIEGAMGVGYYQELSAILKITAEDGGVYYCDEAGMVSTEINDLPSRPIEDFAPIPLYVIL